MISGILESLGVTINSIWLASFLDACGVIAVALAVYIAVRAIKERILLKKSSHRHFALWAPIADISYWLFIRLLWVITLYNISDSLPPHKKIDVFLSNTAFILGCVFAVMALFRLTNVITNYAFPGGNRDLAPLMSRILKIVIFMIGVMVVMRHFNQDIWHIVTALGIGSLAVGLAAQPTLTNIIAGFNLLIDRPFQYGDRVRLSSGEIGDVVHIGLRTTHIRTTDGNMLITPNTDMVNSRVINFSLPNPELGNALKLYFEPSNDMSKIKYLLQQYLVTEEDVIAPSVLLSNVVDGNVEVTVGFKVNDFQKQGPVTDKVIENCLQILAEAGIKMANRYQVPFVPTPR